MGYYSVSSRINFCHCFNNGVVFGWNSKGIFVKKYSLWTHNTLSSDQKMKNEQCVNGSLAVRWLTSPNHNFSPINLLCYLFANNVQRDFHIGDLVHIHNGNKLLYYHYYIIVLKNISFGTLLDIGLLVRYKAFNHRCIY